MVNSYPVVREHIDAIAIVKTMVLSTFTVKQRFSDIWVEAVNYYL